MFSSEQTFYSLLSLLRPYKRPLFKPFWVSTPIWCHHRYLFFKLNHCFSYFGPSLFLVSSYIFWNQNLWTLYSEGWFHCQDVEYVWENQICSDEQPSVWRRRAKKRFCQICIIYVFRLDQALVLTFLSVVLLRNIFHRLFFRRSIYLFALSDFFVNIAEDKENKNETDDNEEDDNERRGREVCASVCGDSNLCRTLLGKLKRGEGPFE